MASSENNKVSEFLEGDDSGKPAANANQVAAFLGKDTFIPDLKCNKANNGILRINIVNRQALYQHWDRVNMHATEPASFPIFRLKFKCFYRHRQDTTWKEVDIFIGNINDEENECYFYLLLNAQLEAYTFTFKLHARCLKSNALMPASETYTVTIPSFVMDIQYQQNENVEFRKNGEYQPRDAVIRKVLGDDMFELEYDRFLFDEDKDGNEFKDGADDLDFGSLPRLETAITTVHLSRLYKQGIDNQYVTRIHSPEMLETVLFIKRHDTTSKRVWRALEDHYSDEAVLFCYDMYDEDEVLVHHKAISYFVTKNIFDFLFEPQFEWKTKCFINDGDGCLQFMNVRQSNIRKNAPLTKSESEFRLNLNSALHSIRSLHNISSPDEEEEDMLVDTDRFDDMKYTCDWCCVDIGEWEYYFSCEADRADRHDVCINCVATVIRLNSALKMVLRAVLDEELIKEIIDCIADFTLGSVIQITDEKEDGNMRNAKLCGPLTPQKRRREHGPPSCSGPPTIKRCRI